MRIPDYSRQLYAGRIVEIGGDEETEPLTLDPPSDMDVDLGFMKGVSAAETVELHRALSAWLAMHRRLHPAWHRAYRETNPGGKE